MKSLTSVAHATSTLVVLVLASSLLAQNTQEKAPANGISFGNQKVAKWRVGVSVTASKGPMQSVQATVPIPISWPEQQVKVVSKDITRGVQVGQRKLNGVRQLLVRMPAIPNRKTARAIVTLEITRKEILEPEDPSVYSIPKKVPRELKRFLNNSPYIESTNGNIKKLARESTADAETAWEKVEAIYEYVRDNIEYTEGNIKSAVRALKDGKGDCEELTSVFIAMCRSIKVPARMVWVPDHCYPEFYLVDDSGTGHWFPCQAAGTRAFGSMPEMRPILQKGDNFSVPEKNKPQRYVAEHVSAKPVRGSGKPRVTFIREYVQAGG